MTSNVITGFQASNIGQYGIGDFSFGTYSRPFTSQSFVAPDTIFAAPGATARSPFFDNPVLDALGQIAAAWFYPVTNIQRASLPGVRDRGQSNEAPVFVVADPRPSPVVPQKPQTLPESVVIDPDLRPTETVFEEEAYFEPGLEWMGRRSPTDWEKVYDQYVVLNKVPEVFDWLESATTIGQLGQTVGWWGGEPNSSLVGPLPGAGADGTYSGKVTVDTRTGKITKCRRRRRRKLLTESDFNVLLRVATLPNKENVRIVLGKAIGRS